VRFRSMSCASMVAFSEVSASGWGRVVFLSGDKGSGNPVLLFRLEILDLLRECAGGRFWVWIGIIAVPIAGEAEDEVVDEVVGEGKVSGSEDEKTPGCRLFNISFACVARIPRLCGAVMKVRTSWNISKSILK